MELDALFSGVSQKNILIFWSFEKKRLRFFVNGKDRRWLVVRFVNFGKKVLDKMFEEPFQAFLNVNQVLLRLGNFDMWIIR